MTLPPPLSWLWKGWMLFSHAFGRVMSFLILTVLWVVGFGIYAIVIKIMNLFRSKTKPETYWLDVQTSPQDSYAHQF